jgi:hypothetical protein
LSAAGDVAFATTVTVRRRIALVVERRGDRAGETRTREDGDIVAQDELDIATRTRRRRRRRRKGSTARAGAGAGARESGVVDLGVARMPPVTWISRRRAVLSRSTAMTSSCRHHSHHPAARTMAASAAAKRLVVFGGTGFVGSGIAKEAVKRGFDVTCVTRGGAAPAHLLGDAERGWASEIDWRRGDALRPETYRDAVRGADAVITAVGRLPMPSLTREEIVRDNGETNVAPGRVAMALGVRRLVVVGASIPPFVPGMAFGWGFKDAAYKVGKANAERFAREEFVGSGGDGDGDGGNNARGAVVLKPGGVSGTRWVDGVAVPLYVAMAPLGFALSKLPSALDPLASLAPVSVECVARAAVRGATEDAYAGKFTVIENLELIRGFGGD